MSDSDSDHIDPELEKELYCQLYFEQCVNETQMIVDEPELKATNMTNEEMNKPCSVSSIESEEEYGLDFSDPPEINISQDNLSSKEKSSVIVCIFCGQSGHSKNFCSAKYCFNCFAPGHLSKDCQIKNKLIDSVCSRCQTRGHTDLICPEIWRQYKQTSQPNSPVVNQMRPSGRGCCYCGCPHHIADMAIRKYDRMNIYKKCEIAMSNLRKKFSKLKKKELKLKKDRKPKIKKKVRNPKIHSNFVDKFEISTPIRDSIKIIDKVSKSQGDSFISLRSIPIEKTHWKPDQDIFSKDSFSKKTHSRRSFKNQIIKNKRN